MKSRPALDCAFLAFAAVASRFLFRSHLLYDLDSVNFALGLLHFDPELHQPHPPGYFLYICLGRPLLAVLHDANTALVALSILASGAAVVAIYALADLWFGRRAALFAGLIFLFSPLCWFHGTVALTYIFDALLSALVGYLCWQTYTGRTGFLVPSAIALAAAMGLRQSSILFLGPLWLLSLRKAAVRKILQGIAALGLSVLAWFLPMAVASGGLARYFISLYDLWSRVPAAQTVFSSSFGAAFALAVTRLSTITLIFALCFGAAAPLLFLKSKDTGLRREEKLFTWVWIAPSLLFFTFVYLKFVNSGYLLVASPPIFAWLGTRAAAWRLDLPLRAWQKTAVLASVGALHMAAFLYLPLYCSYRSVRKFEAELRGIQKSLRQVGSPQDTMIVAFDAHFLGYRHAGYYLPDYWTVQFPEVPLPAGRRVFAMYQGQTQLLNRLPDKQFRNFVLFPLPDEPSYREYLQDLQAAFPKGALRSERVGGHEFLIGSTADLHFMFPLTGP
ncbi:MAG: DUF2723 domain-containing protein [Acidobacteria bacterium]|nr:DUF2723 domain-containing protein [Acidobacteriota bacterium]